MPPPNSDFVGVSVLDAGIPPNPQHILGATGAQAVVAERIRATFAARDRRKGSEPAVLTESGFFRKLR